MATLPKTAIPKRLLSAGAINTNALPIGGQPINPGSKRQADDDWATRHFLERWAIADEKRCRRGDVRENSPAVFMDLFD